MPLQGTEEDLADLLEGFELLSLEDRAGIAFDLLIFGCAAITDDGRRLDPRDVPEEPCSWLAVHKWSVRKIGAHSLVVAPGRQAQTPGISGGALVSATLEPPQEVLLSSEPDPMQGHFIVGHTPARITIKMIKTPDGWRADQHPEICNGARLAMHEQCFTLFDVVHHLDGTVSFDLEPVGV